MSILTADERKRLKPTDFAIPSERKYPIHNPDHARNALSRVAQFGSPAEKTAVRAAVHKRYPNIGKTDESKEDPKEEAAESPAQEKVEDKQETASQKKIQKMYKK